MRNPNALRLAGGARRVEHVGKVPRAEGGQWNIVCALPGDGIPIGVQLHHHRRPERQHLLDAAMSQQNLHPAVFHHVGQPVRRKRGVQRHVGAAGFQYAQNAHHHLQRALEAESHQHIRANPQPPQVAGQMSGAAVEFAVAQALLFQHQGRPLRSPPRLLFDQLMQTEIALRILHGRVVPASQQLPALTVGQHRQLRYGLVRVADDRLQQRPVVLAHLPDGGGFEQIGVVFDQPFEPILGLGDEQRQIELRRAGLQTVHAGNLGNFRDSVGVVQNEHHLEQRRAAGIALRGQLARAVNEGHLGMSVGAQRPLPRLLQQARGSSAPR